MSPFSPFCDYLGWVVGGGAACQQVVVPVRPSWVMWLLSRFLHSSFSVVCVTAGSGQREWRVPSPFAESFEPFNSSCPVLGPLCRGGGIRTGGRRGAHFGSCTSSRRFAPPPSPHVVFVLLFLLLFLLLFFSFSFILICYIYFDFSVYYFMFMFMFLIACAYYY